MGEPRPGSRPGRRVTLTEAAEVLGMSRDAVRMRVRRGSLRSEKGEDGKVYVFVDPTRDRPPDAEPQAQDEGSSGPLVDALKDEISHLRRESERKDAIIMSLSQSNAELSRTIRAIEAPSTASESPQEPREAPAEATEQPGRVGPQTPLEGAQEATERPWWRRVFGG